MDIIDARRKGPYKEEGGLEYALKKLFVRMENEGFRREKIREAMADFRESFLRDADGKEIKFADQLRKGKTEEDFNNWFFSIQSFTVKYSIKFENRELQLLSPGQKGIVLLLVYLEVDQGDTRPLIIDQPEDNLDNLSVYSNLIEYFRQRKKTRQIIIITHNPNLVVNTDAEQIVIADYDGTRSPRIRYRSGALEDTRESGARLGIREGCL